MINQKRGSSGFLYCKHWKNFRICLTTTILYNRISLLYQIKGLELMCLKGNARHHKVCKCTTRYFDTLKLNSSHWGRAESPREPYLQAADAASYGSHAARGQSRITQVSDISNKCSFNASPAAPNHDGVGTLGVCWSWYLPRRREERQTRLFWRDMELREWGRCRCIGAYQKGLHLPWSAQRMSTLSWSRHWHELMMNSSVW